MERAPSPASRRELEPRLTAKGQAYPRDPRARRDEAPRAVASAMPAAERNAPLEG
ncbi:hypothetical protein NKH77_15490 [Streptomyces sp. M19]